jgi:hypothetical protein
MATKYLYIDDEDQASLDSYIRAVSGARKINIVSEPPSQFDEQVRHLLEVLKRYDGLILDWQLDDIATADGKAVAFRAGSLAQEIRTRETSKEIKPLPIILWSTKPKLRKSYTTDNTSHDLFDHVYDKATVVDEAERVQLELISLALGYQKIASHKSSAEPGEILGIDQEDFERLNRSLVKALPSRDQPVHSYARFILKELVLRPGPLICEELLAARLGIDKDRSTDWKKLLTRHLKKGAYLGPFSDAWPRWWSDSVEKKWWYSLGEKSPALSSLNARQRVKRISAATKLKKLVPAEPIAKSYSDYFQTICEVTRRPLDPVDGVIIDEPEPKAWQDRRYISIEVALERRGEDDDLRPDVSERERLKEIRDSRMEHAEA